MGDVIIAKRIRTQGPVHATYPFGLQRSDSMLICGAARQYYAYEKACLPAQIPASQHLPA